MTLTHTGSTKKYATGWDNVFGGRKKKPADGVKPAKKKAAAKKKRRS